MKPSLGEKIFNICNHIFFLLIGWTMIYPFINTLAKSLSNNNSVLRGEVNLLPKGFNLVSYMKVIENKLFLVTMGNTVFITAVGTVLTLIVVFMAAYALSKRYLFLRKQLSFFFLFTMLFNGGMIPLFLQVRNLGLYDTLWSLILPTTMNVYYMLLARAFIMQHPESIEESAIIDGANQLQIFIRIILPMSKPILATIALFSAVHYWNTFMHGVIFIQSQNKYPLQVYVRLLVFNETVLSANTDNYLNTLIPEQTGMETLKMAILMIATIPILCVYPFVQKYFISIKLGAVKG